MIGYPLWIPLLVCTLYAKMLKPSSFPIPTFLFSFFKNSSLHIQSLSMFFNETSKVTETKTIVLVRTVTFYKIKIITHLPT